MLLVRVVFAGSLVIQGWFYLQGAGDASPRWLTGLAALACGALLLIGFLTPLAATAAGLGAIGVGLSLLPACTATLFNAKPAIVFAGTILIEIIVLGPGAFSLDALAFGRREIIIPPPVAQSHR